MVSTAMKRRVAWRSGGVQRLRSVARPQADGVTMATLAVVIGACIFLQRFAVPFGDSQIPASFAVGYLGFLWLLLRGRLNIDRQVFGLFLATLAFMTLSLIVSATRASLLSFGYLLAIYALYVFRLKHPAGCFARALNIFLTLMSVCALLGMAQFALQFVVNQDLVFPLDSYMPESILLDGYNVIIPLSYGDNVMRSNGVFFLEPSFFSQFLGLAVVIELLGARRATRLLLFAGAMLVCYSGTGLLLVFVFLPWILMRRGNASVIFAMGVLAIVLSLAGGVIDLDTLTGRVSEFSSTESSGFARFISPFYMLRDFAASSTGTFLFGRGPGAIEQVMKEAFTYDAYLAFDPTWIKLILEYGFFSAVSFAAFIGAALFRGTRNRMLSWAILFFYLFLGGYLLNGLVHCLFVVLCVWHNREARAPQLVSRRAAERLHRIRRLRLIAARPSPTPSISAS
jgi:hypothetical protein